MIRAHEITPLLLALMAAAVAGAVALFMTVAPSGAALPDSFETGIAPPEAPNPIASPGIPAFDRYAVITERPLFNAGRTRDPVPPEAQGAQPQLPPLTDFRLVGIIVSGDVRRALVERGPDNVVTLKPGDNLDGYAVLRIDSKGVVLKGTEREEALTFPRFSDRPDQGVAMMQGSAQANR